MADRRRPGQPLAKLDEQTPSHPRAEASSFSAYPSNQPNERNDSKSKKGLATEERNESRAAVPARNDTPKPTRPTAPSGLETAFESRPAQKPERKGTEENVDSEIILLTEEIWRLRDLLRSSRQDRSRLKGQVRYWKAQADNRARALTELLRKVPDAEEHQDKNEVRDSDVDFDDYDDEDDYSGKRAPDIREMRLRGPTKSP